MLANLTQIHLPVPLLKQFVPDIYANREDRWKTITPEQILPAKVKDVLEDYNQACGRK